MGYIWIICEYTVNKGVKWSQKNTPQQSNLTCFVVGCDSLSSNNIYSFHSLTIFKNFDL